jgi:hypothetical protein
MENKHFFIYLPSNTKKEQILTENNTATKYVTLLPQPLVTQNYYVGIKEFFIKNSINNIDTEFKTIFYFTTAITNPKHPEIVAIKKSENNNIILQYEDIELNLKKYQIAIGHYQNIEDFCLKLKNVFPTIIRNQIYIKPDPILNKIYIKIPSNSVLAWPNQFTSLGRLCGFDQDILFQGEYTARYEPFQFKGVEEFNICVDLIDNQKIGNKLLPVLVTVPKKGKRDEILHYIFNKPQFFPINKDITDIIRVTIVDNKGEEVILQKGQVLLVLECKHKEELQK